MTLDPAPDSSPGLVVCVGLPSDQIIEIAHLLRGRATVLATPDAEGARAVLANQAAPRRPAGVARRGLDVQPERFDNPGPSEGRSYGRHLPEQLDDRFAERDNPTEHDNLAEVSLRAAAERRSTALSTPPTPPQPPPVTPDGAVGGHGGRFRPTSGVLAQAPAAGPARPATGALAAVTGAVRTVTAAIPAVTGSIPMTAPPTLDPLMAGPLLVDLAGREVTALGRRVYLSAREFDLLATLALEAGRVWSFAELTARVWQLPYLGDSDPVTSAVKRLRKRLAPVRDVEVASVRGVGYRLRVRT